MRRSIAFFLVVLLMSGCGSATEADVAGAWSGEIKMSLQSMQEDAGGDNEQSMFLNEQEAQGAELSLQLREDGSCTFTALVPVEGTWSLDGSTVVLVLPDRQSADGGKAFSGTYKLELAGDSEMSGNDPGVDGVTLTFNK